MLMAASSSSASGRRLPTERPTQHHEQLNQNQSPLNCPRCESSNTKFCYYNNYSLFQPRHFCKACKRYWTRGGTLRNVPIGGGCRKNKRMRRPFASSVGAVPTTATPNTSVHPQSVVARSSNVDVSASRSTSHVNPLFFDMGGAPYPRLHPTIGLLPHLHSARELGFSSSGFVAGDGGGCGDNNYIQDLVSSGPIHSVGFSTEGIRCSNTGIVTPILGSLDPTAILTTNVPTPSMAPLLASTNQQQKFFAASLKDIKTNSEDFKSFSSFQDLGDVGIGDNEFPSKEVKTEGMNVPGWSFGFQNQMELSNQVPHYWNITSDISAWNDPTNTGSSVPSLI